MTLEELRAKAMVLGQVEALKHKQRGPQDWTWYLVRVGEYGVVVVAVMDPNTRVRQSWFPTEQAALEAYIADQKARGYPHLNGIDLPRPKQRLREDKVVMAKTRKARRNRFTRRGKQ